MNISLAEKEIQRLLNCGVRFEYTFTDSVINMYNINPNLPGYSFTDIINQLKPGEKLIFKRNDGFGTGVNYHWEYDSDYDGSIYWRTQDNIEYIRINSTLGSIDNWILSIEETQKEITSDSLFYAIIKDIDRINELDGRSIPVRFVKYNEEFGEFSAEVIKMLGCTQKPYDQNHLIEESADALQCLLSILIHIYKEKNIEFNVILSTILEKNKKWEAKIKEYTNKFSS